MDKVDAQGLRFFRTLALPGASIIRPPATLRAAADASTAVVVAQVAGVRATRYIKPDGRRDGAYLVGVELNVTEVIRGELVPSTPRPIVEFLVMDRSALPALRKSMPKGSAVWFLHWQGINRADPSKPTSALDKKYYSLTSLQGVVVQGTRGAFSPLAEDVVRGEMAKDATKHAKLSAAVASLR